MPAAGLPPLYLKLLRSFRLRPIRSDEDYDRAGVVLLALDERWADLSDDERDYHEVLVTLIKAYDEENYPTADVSGPELLQCLIENRGLTQAEVARRAKIGESALSEMLSGKRPMGLKVIRTLANFFEVAPSLFVTNEKTTTV